MGYEPGLATHGMPPQVPATRHATMLLSQVTGMPVNGMRAPMHSAGCVSKSGGVGPNVCTYCTVRCMGEADQASLSSRLATLRPRSDHVRHCREAQAYISCWRQNFSWTLGHWDRPFIDPSVL